MRRMVAAFARGTATLTGAWPALCLGTWWCAEAMGGQPFAERLSPYANAHLLEEAAEGRYAPASDPVFWAWRLLPTAVALTAGTFVAGRGSRAAAILLAFLCVIVFAILHREMFRPHAPRPALVALYLELAVAAV